MARAASSLFSLPFRFHYSDSPAIFSIPSLLEGTRTFAKSFANSAPRSSELPLFLRALPKMYDNGGANGARKVHAPSEVMKAQTPGGLGGRGSEPCTRVSREATCHPPGVLPSRRSSFPFLSSLLHRGQSARIAKREKGTASRFYIAPQKRSAICRTPNRPRCHCRASVFRGVIPPDGKGEGLHRLRSGDFFAFEIRRAAGRLDGRNNRREATRSTKPRYAGTLKRDVQRIFLSLSLALFLSLSAR